MQRPRQEKDLMIVERQIRELRNKNSEWHKMGFHNATLSYITYLLSPTKILTLSQSNMTYLWICSQQLDNLRTYELNCKYIYLSLH